MVRNGNFEMKKEPNTFRKYISKKLYKTIPDNPKRESTTKHSAILVNAQKTICQMITAHFQKGVVKFIFTKLRVDQEIFT